MTGVAALRSVSSSMIMKRCPYGAKSNHRLPLALQGGPGHSASGQVRGHRPGNRRARARQFRRVVLCQLPDMMKPPTIPTLVSAGADECTAN